MRVVFITHDPILYGSTRSLLDLIDGLRPYGVEPLVIYPAKGELTGELKKRDVPQMVVPFANWMVRDEQRSVAKVLRRFARNAALLPALCTRIGKWKADIVYTNSSVIPIGAYMAWFLRKPHVWHIREFGHGLSHDFGKSYFRFWLNRSAAILAVSEAIRTSILAGLQPPSHVVYNGVISRAACLKLGEEARRREQGEQFIFTIVGHLLPLKGQEEAIRALGVLRDEYPRARLLVAGSGSEWYERELLDLCSEIGVEDRVTFKGFIPDPFDIYRECDAVLMCSRHEGMGRVTVEAMAAARPVIGFKGGGTPELIEEGRTGLSYEGGAEELAACMAILMDDRARAREMGMQGWERAEEAFTTEAYAGRVYRILSGVFR